MKCGVGDNTPPRAFIPPLGLRCQAHRTGSALRCSPVARGTAQVFRFVSG